jgi:hypothetical protein
MHSRRVALFGPSLGALLAIAGVGCGSSSSNDEPHVDASAPSIDAPVARPDAHIADDAHATPDGGARDSGRAVEASTHDASDARVGPDAAALDAPVGTAQPAPQVPDLGGAVIATPKIQLIAYSEDPMLTAAGAFITQLGSTTEWATQTSEYAVGAFTQLPTIAIDGTPPASLDDNSGNPTPFEQTLATNLSGTSPAWGAADPNTIYVFLLPLGTNISSGGNCCTDFLGYHYDAPVGSISVPYAIVCDCAPQAGDPTTALEYVTTTESHEMVEAATDPFPDSNPAYAQTDDADFIWTYVTGGEVADMCEYNTDSNYAPPGATYELQRSWSNTAAVAGTNPCVPVPATGPYFNSYAIYSDAISVSDYGSPVQTTGVKIAVGDTRTIDVVLTSQAATSGPWTVKAWDMNDYLGTAAANTTLTLDQSSGSNGDVLHLTIKVNSYDPNLGGAGIILESTLDGQDNLTMVAVGG